jgi:hypothetical protein
MNTSVDHPNKNLVSCCYVNASSKFKVVRICSLNNTYLEKVVLPGTKFYFEAQPESFLEVYSSDTIQSILEARIACSHLQI